MRFFRFFLAFMLLILSIASPGNFCLALNREFMYDTEGQRDPFLSLLEGGVELSDLEEISIENILLEGIIYDPAQGSMAIINGEIYRPYDFLGGFEITEIGHNHIKVSKESVLYTIKLPADEDK